MAGQVRSPEAMSEQDEEILRVWKAGDQALALLLSASTI